jgi:alpha-glucosidase
MAAVYYMPLGWFYWYDVPSKYADSASWPELSWFDSVPTVWDESRALAGEVGQYVVIARRSGSTWFLGAMTSEQARVVEVPLSFLGTGQWQATIYADGTPGDNPYTTPVTISTQTVTAATTLTIRMACAGGQAIRFTAA